jgi:hypothetical protein
LQEVQAHLAALDRADLILRPTELRRDADLGVPGFLANGPEQLGVKGKLVAVDGLHEGGAPVGPTEVTALF